MNMKAIYEECQRQLPPAQRIMIQKRMEGSWKPIQLMPGMLQIPSLERNPIQGLNLTAAVWILMAAGSQDSNTGPCEEINDLGRTEA